MFELRDYQALNKMQIRQQFKHHKQVMYQAGTGSGKTVTAASIVADADQKDNGVWFIAHRRELIRQSNKTLEAMGVRSGIIMAGYRYHPHLNVHCASIDTLRERMIKNDKLVVLKKPKLIVIDEAHRSLSKSYRDVIDHFREAWLLGLSATPIRSDGRGLGHMYGSMVQSPPVDELIAAGWLVQPRYFTGASADLEGVALHNYDYARGELEARMNHADLRGDVVEQWIRHAENRKTIVFASGVKHSLALKEDFEAAGIPAMHIDGHTLNAERADLIEDFRSNDKYKVLCNCMIVTEGFDVPEVGCVQVATSTKIISKWLQMGGRALRPDGLKGQDLVDYLNKHGDKNPDKIKTDCILIDHGSNITRHGFVEDPVPWELTQEGRITDHIAEAREEMVRQFECHMCGAVFSGQVRCPECGTRLEVQGQHELISTSEELIEVTRGAMGVRASDDQKIYTDAQRKNFLSQVRGYAAGCNPRKKVFGKGWVSHTYRAKFGEWPDGLDHVPPSEPEALVKAFIRAKNANYHIRRNYNANRA